MPDAAEEDDTWSFWWEAGANIATNYLWRGYDQPYTFNLNTYGFPLWLSW